MFTRVPIRTIVLSALILLAFMLPKVQASDVPSTETKVYLPFVAKEAPLPTGLQVVRYIFTEWPNLFPSYDWAYGHIENLSTMPLFLVKLEMDVTAGTCFEVDPCESWEMPPEAITPAFVATLPNQPNPYQSNSYMQYKTYYSLGTPRVVDARRSAPDGRSYDALTVVRVQRNTSDSTRAEGIVRNDTDHVLEAARVVVYVPNACPWEEAVLSISTLEPGQESTFHTQSYMFGLDPCKGVPLKAVGQGVVVE